MDEDAIKDLMGNITGAIEEFAESLNKLIKTSKKSSSVMHDETDKRIASASSFDSLNDVVRDTTDEQEDYLKVVEASIAVWGSMTSAVSTAATVLMDMTKSALGGEGFDMFKSMIDPISKMMESLGKVVGSVVGGMFKLGGDLPFIGGLFEGFGSAIEGAGEALGKMAAAAFKFVATLTLDAVEQLWNMFEGTASAGLLVANGMHEMLDSAKALNLTTQEYTKLIQNQTANLSEFGGSVAGGAKQLKAVAKASADHNQELRGLGISYQEQAEMTSEFMSSLQRTGQLTLMTTTQIADASFEYMKNLRIISALTGKTAENMKKDRDAALSNLAFQSKLAQMDPAIRKEMESALAGMPEGMQQAFKESVIFGKVMTDTGAIVSGASVYIEKFANSIANGETTFQDAFTNFRADLKENGPELRKNILGLAAAGMAELLGRGNVITSSINEFSESLLRQLAIAEGSLIDDVAKTGAAGKTAGESITSVIEMMDTQRELMHAILSEAEKRMGPLATILVGITKNVKSVFETVSKQVDSGAVSAGIESVKGMTEGIVTTIKEAMEKVSKTMDATFQLIKDITDSGPFKLLFGKESRAAGQDPGDETLSFDAVSGGAGKSKPFKQSIDELTQGRIDIVRNNKDRIAEEQERIDNSNKGETEYWFQNQAKGREESQKIIDNSKQMIEAMNKLILLQIKANSKLDKQIILIDGQH